MSEHTLSWRGQLPPAGSIAAVPQLIDMPAGLRRARVQVEAAEALGPQARALLGEVLGALRTHARAGADAEAHRIALRGLPERQRELVEDLLGEGEVHAEVGGAAHWIVQESVLPGLWRIEMHTPDGASLRWLEVAAVPSPIRRAAAELPRETVALPTQLPAGAMNAPALIAELAARAQAWRAGELNHVVNFTLLPLSETDAAVLTSTLGQIPLVIHSGGYGSCRIYALGLRRVWAVQYLNSMGKVILDTLEVGDVPVAACAAAEDFEDSAARLDEILEAYAA